MSNVFILKSEQAAWHYRPLIEAEPGAANGGTLVLNNSSGSPISVTGIEIVGQQEGSTFDVLNRGADPINLLANNAEADFPYRFADAVTLAADASARIYYNGKQWEILAVGGEGSTGSPNTFPIYGADGSQEESSLKIVPTDRLHWYGDSFSLWVPNFINFQGAWSAIRIGNNRDQFVPIAPAEWRPYYFIDIEPVVELKQNIGAYGIFCNVQARTATAGMGGDVVGVNGGVYSYGNGYNGSLHLVGVQGSCYARSYNEAAAIGGSFSSWVGGGSGGSNTTPLWGVFAQALGGHNGYTPTARGGEFKVSNIGGGGLGYITEGIGVLAVFDASPPATQFEKAKGFALQGWVAGGGVYNKSYGIYADTSIDVGAERWFIYSLSLSDSLFSGAVRGPHNPYGAGWASSNKFATEKGVYDKVEALVLAAGGIVGSGTTFNASYWTGPTTLGSLPFRWDGDTYQLYHTNRSTDSFQVLISTTPAGLDGYMIIGDQTGAWGMYIDEYNILIGSAEVTIGKQFDSVAAKIEVGLGPLNEAIRFNAADLRFFRRTLTPPGTTGAQTINQAIGTVNLAAGQTAIVVTNSYAKVDSIIFPAAQKVDATAKSFEITRANGSFTITANAAATAELPIGFLVTN